MVRRVILILTLGALFLALLTPTALAKRPTPRPESSLTLTLVCDWEPVPEGGFPPIPVPHLDAVVTWQDVSNRADLSISAGDVIDGDRRGWGGHRESLWSEPDGSRDLHLDVWIAPGDRMWATATIVDRKGSVAHADVEIDC